MIRISKCTDYSKIANLWLETSFQAHSFVDNNYWYKMQNSVIRDCLPNSKTFVFEDRRQIKGFISLVDNNHIAALFVAPKFQNKRIGSKLLNYVRRNIGHLSLKVFVKNGKALRFYQRNDFKIIREQIEPSTKEKELTLAWAMGCKSGLIKRFQGDS